MSQEAKGVVSDSTLMGVVRSGKGGALYARLEEIATLIVEMETKAMRSGGVTEPLERALRCVSDAVIDTKIDLECAIEAHVLEKAKQKSLDLVGGKI